jgi:hypothetical protein
MIQHAYVYYCGRKPCLGGRIRAERSWNAVAIYPGRLFFAAICAAILSASDISLFGMGGVGWSAARAARVSPPPFSPPAGCAAAGARGRGCGDGGENAGG